MDKYIGRLLDNRYEILEMIGSGGMAVVYKARCHRLNRLVAIKILKDDYLEDEDFRRRFHAESQAVAMLSHPNIVSVYDVSTSISMEADYIVMELIEGITLKQYMEKKGVLNWKETLHFGIQIAKALEHAHSRGVVHRDIKPHNIMVLKNGSVKVADFGIARLMFKGETLTKEALGSVHYISPEQAKGGRVDNRSDIYSLGVVMYEMMSGRPPYEGESPVSVAIQHINGGAVLPSTLNPNIPGGMEQIIMKAMAPDLKNRYTTTTQMLADMDEFRKNPTLLFEYNMPPLDAVTNLNKKPLVLDTTGTKTTADRMEEKAAEHRNRRQAEKTAAAAAEAKRERRQEYASDGQGSRIATAAIIACSLVAIVAIILFLVLFLNNANNEAEKIKVPNLVGRYYDVIKNADNSGNYVIKEAPVREYHDTYDEGMIISQTPEDGTEMVKGGTITVTVSKGKQETPIYMIDVLNMTQKDAETKLDNLSLGLKYSIEHEYNENVDAGKVIRTDPQVDVELSSGQTVTLVISDGKPPAEKKKVPDVVGIRFADAQSIMNNAGFPNIESELVFDEADPGIVVSQSEEKDTKIPADTTIILYVSKGVDPEATEPTEPDETEPEDTEPEDTEPEKTEPPETEPQPTEPQPTEPQPTESQPTEPDGNDPSQQPEPTSLLGRIIRYFVDRDAPTGNLPQERMQYCNYRKTLLWRKV